MTLRELLTDAEKRCRDLAEILDHTWRKQAVELRDLSRTTRRKSHFPTWLALRHSIERLQDADKKAEALFDRLSEELQLIREHAQRERLARR
jgi:hypothetical protein